MEGDYGDKNIQTEVHHDCLWVTPCSLRSQPDGKNFKVNKPISSGHLPFPQGWPLNRRSTVIFFILPLPLLINSKTFRFPSQLTNKITNFRWLENNSSQRSCHFWWQWWVSSCSILTQGNSHLSSPRFLKAIDDLTQNPFCLVLFHCNFTLISVRLTVYRVWDSDSLALLVS